VLLGIGDWGLGIGPNPQWAQSPIPKSPKTFQKIKKKVKNSKFFKKIKKN
jgi:hypothetical protein